MCVKTIDFNDVYCVWVGGMKARLNDMLANFRTVNKLLFLSTYYAFLHFDLTRFSNVEFRISNTF